MCVEKLALSKEHFTKEFPGFEVESKWNLLTENPIPTVLRFVDDVSRGTWGPFIVAEVIGRLKTGTKLLEAQYDFWAAEDPGSSKLEQVAKTAYFPGFDFYQVIFKEGSNKKIRLHHGCTINPPLVRSEERIRKVVRGEKAAIEIITRRFPNSQNVGSFFRQKCSIYIQNTTSHRNFSISADFCSSGNKHLSQVEVEYKGRNGVWFPDNMGCEIAEEFGKIHAILVNLYGDVLLPTDVSKFEWLTA